MYTDEFVTHCGQNVWVQANKERGTVFLQLSDPLAEEGFTVSLNFKEFNQLRQMLTMADSEMGW